MDEHLQNISRQIINVVDKLVDNGCALEQIAACLVTTGMSIYKTMLSPDDYENIIDVISETRDKIKTMNDYESTTLQ